MKLLAFAGSLRTESYNKKFAQAALEIAKEQGAKGEFLDLRDYPMPLYDGDIQDRFGLPEQTLAFSEKIAAADALIISAPEYNGSIPGVLKNCLDWLSRQQPGMALANQHLLLLAASPGALGGVRSLWHTRVPFEALGVHVFPTMVGLPMCEGAFDTHGRLKAERAGPLESAVHSFVAYLRAFRELSSEESQASKSVGMARAGVGKSAG